jgi:hypothetical protein
MNQKYSLLFLFLSLLLTHCEQTAKRVSTKAMNISDSVPTIAKAQDMRRSDIKDIFLTMPDEYLKSAFAGSLTLKQRQEILAKNTKNFQDITIDEKNHYLLYSKSAAKQGMITTIATFCKKDGEEIYAVDISKWLEEKNAIQTESESFHLLKKGDSGAWEDLTLADYVPKIELQDFFKQEIVTRIKQADHNYLPILVYELPRKGNRIKVFLGELVMGADKFQYKPDVEFIELEWNGEKFEKVGTANY